MISEGTPTFNGEVMHPTEYLKAAELDGREVTLTISDIVKEQPYMPGAGKTDAWVATFRETPKKVILNKTNEILIAKACGIKKKPDNTLPLEESVGHQITLYPTTCQVGSDSNYPCIRVKSRTNIKKPKPASDPGSAPATEQRLPVTEQESPQPQAASGSVPKANRDIAESIATQDTEPVLADVGRVADLLSVDMDDERWSRLISQGSIRAAINTMLDEVE